MAGRHSLCCALGAPQVPGPPHEMRAGMRKSRYRLCELATALPVANPVGFVGPEVFNFGEQAERPVLEWAARLRCSET